MSSARNDILPPDMHTVLITGSNTGIGYETALLFARNGYQVFAGARDPANAPLLEQAVADGLSITPVTLDVNSDASVAQAVATVLEHAPRIDVLINNAGIGGAGAIEMFPIEAARALFETNFFGAIRTIRAVIPGMRERRAGVIVNVTSIMGRLTLGCHGFYTASKFALTAASESLAAEVKPFGIRVVVIEPGVIVTPIWNKDRMLMPQEHPYTLAEHRLMRLFVAQLKGGTRPGIVAQAILGAVQSETPKLHYLVGEDAVNMMAARHAMSGEDWVALQSEPDEERFLAEAQRLFGADLYNPPSLHARTRVKAQH